MKHAWWGRPREFVGMKFLISSSFNRKNHQKVPIYYFLNLGQPLGWRPFAFVWCFSLPSSSRFAFPPPSARAKSDRLAPHTWPAGTSPIHSCHTCVWRANCELCVPEPQLPFFPPLFGFLCAAILSPNLFFPPSFPLPCGLPPSPLPGRPMCLVSVCPPSSATHGRRFLSTRGSL